MRLRRESMQEDARAEQLRAIEDAMLHVRAAAAGCRTAATMQLHSDVARCLRNAADLIDAAISDELEPAKALLDEHSNFLAAAAE